MTENVRVSKGKKSVKLLVAMMLAILITSMFTVTASANAFKPYGASAYLNLYGNSGMYGRVLTLYNQYNGPDQQFGFSYTTVSGTSYVAYYLLNNQSSSYAVNRRSSDASAWMYYFNSGGAYDSAFSGITLGGVAGGQNFKLRNYSEYMDALSNANGSGVYFRPSSVQTPTKWDVKVV